MATIRLETFSNVKFNIPKIEAEIKQALDKSSSDVASDFNSVTATWKGSPKATIRRESEEKRLIGVEDNRWLWNNNGTRPHVIRPRGSGTLSFRTGYRRKTTPNRLGSRSGGSFGNRVRAKEVRHPGNKASLWNRVSAKRRGPELNKAVVSVIKRNT